jgi:hypothetical protein
MRCPKCRLFRLTKRGMEVHFRQFPSHRQIREVYQTRYTPIPSNVDDQQTSDISNYAMIGAIIDSQPQRSTEDSAPLVPGGGTFAGGGASASFADIPDPTPAPSPTPEPSWVPDYSSPSPSPSYESPSPSPSYDSSPSPSYDSGSSSSSYDSGSSSSGGDSSNW